MDKSNSIFLSYSRVFIRLYATASINVKTGHPEFISYKAVPFADIDFSAFSFKADVYRKALTYFKKEFKEIK